jgi:hypothetical protein
MDPNATIDEAERLIVEDDPEEAMFALDAYDNWRARGGFGTPEMDARAKRLREQLSKQALIE